jgi:O-antigen/teichoic acid export membrane protein
VFKQIIGYIPSNVVPAIVSMAMIYAYTRLLTPASFGTYSLIFAIVVISQTSFFYALPVAVLRFFPAAEVAGCAPSFLKETYTIFFATSAALVAIAAVIGLLIPKMALHTNEIWLVVPLLVLRSAVLVNQAVNRASNRMGRFNFIECAHAVLGFGLGLVFIRFMGPHAEAVVLGMLVAAGLCAAADTRLLLSPFRREAGPVRREALLRLVNFAWPLIAAAVTAALLQMSDRFLLNTLGGVEMLGIYTVAYGLVERPITLISSAISTATFSMAVEKLETQGRDAGRIQAGKNGTVLLALVVPACLGLAFASDNIAAVLVGADFRQGVAELIPIMAVTALCHGFRAHFIDHAFHFAGRSNLMLWIYGPAAAANILLNLVAIPHFGIMGAAGVGLLCQTLAAAGSWWLGRRVFPLWLPPEQMARLSGALLPMVLVLWYLEFPLNWYGLIEAVGVGFAAFATAAVALDVGGIRRFLRPQRKPAMAG